MLYFTNCQNAQVYSHIQSHTELCRSATRLEAHNSHLSCWQLNFGGMDLICAPQSFIVFISFIYVDLCATILAEDTEEYSWLLLCHSFESFHLCRLNLKPEEYGWNIKHTAGKPWQYYSVQRCYTV